ncbi:MAG TPA: class I SAM-dependent methyltransferase [Gammaproteobacteria bacterium]|nr:class I SAM-dependent methyltransferase [Gammaproteobacteria bacterium]
MDNSPADRDKPYGTLYHSSVRHQYALKLWLREFFSTWKQPGAFARTIDGLPQGARVLDAGCGQGTLLAELAKYRPDLKLTGIDMAPAGEAKGFVLLSGDILHMPFPDGEFDLVFSRQVIEHIADNTGVIREFARVIRPGGILYVDCPDVRNTMAWSPMSFWEDPTHLRPYTRRGLQRLFLLSGLQPKTAGRIRDWRLVLLGVFYLPIAWLNRDPFFVRHWLANICGVFIFGIAVKPAGPKIP